MVDKLPVDFSGNPVGAMAQAERRLQFHLVLQLVLLDKLLKGVDNVIGALEMAGAAHTDINFHNFLLIK